jgi:tRNA nucleotidyltransferase (CCA-adding enzyme)
MKHLINDNLIPKYVTHVTSTLENANFEAFIVGGCVRDLILDREPKDWDITTNATPEQIQALFPHTVYENTFGTVGIVMEEVISDERTGNSKLIGNVSYETETNNISRETTDSPDTSSKSLVANIVEVTPYRTESNYSDNRHPDSVEFSDKIEDDLGRRDFTINAMAYSPSKGHLIDLYKGQEDIKDKTIRAVGNPDERFQEDALRMLRAIRFASQLGFAVSYETLVSIEKNADLIKNISAERIRDEFVKIIESDSPVEGIALLQKLGLLKHIIPELEEGIGCAQGGAHIFDVFEHLLQALGHASDKGWPLYIRLSALFHDIGKPRTKRQGKLKPTFYGHEVVGARMAEKIMDRLKFPKKDTELVAKFVRWHMFFSDTEQITLSAVRRMIANVGSASAQGSGETKPEYIWDLMKVRECDRVGMKKKEAPYRLRKYHAMIEECLRDPISVKQLKINGGDLMTLGEKPGPKFALTLHALLEEVLENPEKNEKEILLTRAKELLQLPFEELKMLGEKAKEIKEEADEREVAGLRKKHGV